MSVMKRSGGVAVLCLWLSALNAGAQTAPGGAGNVHHTAPAGASAPDHAVAPEAAAVAAFREANAKMHAGMDLPSTGDTDADFARGMLAHHQGAVDMARIELEHGSDSELQQLAERIIASQEGEIVQIQAWLARNGY